MHWACVDPLNSIVGNGFLFCCPATFCFVTGAHGQLEQQIKTLEESCQTQLAALASSDTSAQTLKSKLDAELAAKTEVRVHLLFAVLRMWRGFPYSLLLMLIDRL